MIGKTFKSIIELENTIEAKYGADVVSFKEIGTDTYILKLNDGKSVEILYENSLYDGDKVTGVYVS